MSTTARHLGVRRFEASVLVLAALAVLWGFVEWTRDLPTFSGIAVVALASIPILVRTSIPVVSSAHVVTISLTAAVLYAGRSDEGTHIFPLWAVLVALASWLLQARPRRRFNPRLGFQVLGGAALVEASRITDFGPHPYDRVLTGLAAYCLTIWLLEEIRHRLIHGEHRQRVWSVPNLVIAIALLGLMSSGIAVLRLMLQGPDETPRSGILVLFSLLLVMVATLLARVERNRVTARALAEAAVAMPWPLETIDERLCAAARSGVRAREVKIDGAPTDNALSVQLRDRRHVVLRRGPGELAFTRADHELVRALVAMADASRVHADHEHQLRTAATTDDLTGLWTYGYFREVLQKAFQQRNPGEQIAVYFLDLDHFKELNDTLGHLATDHVVRELGNRLLTQLPVDAFPSRFGGDEFVLMLRNVHGPGHCESVRHQISNIVAEPMTVDGAVVKLECTIGVSVSGEPDDDRDRIVAEAEREMRTRKLESRALQQGPQWVGELSLVQELVSTGGIDVAFQPIVDLRDDSLMGYEALVRASHPALGRLSPVQMISSAIRLGILDEVTEVIAEQAIDTVSRVAASLDRRLTLSVNIEYQQLRDGSRLLDWLCERVDGAGIDLILEVSERKIGLWHSVHLHLAQMLRDSGIGLALDDFGAGQATFSVVSDWEWDWVKIDRAFLGSMGERGRAMLPHVVRMLDELGTTIVQEGIETLEHLAVIRELNVHLAQGIRLGAPQSGAEILANPSVPGLPA